MKKLLLFLLFSTAVVFSANAQSPTTQEEYNYATRGLKIQRATGLDMKIGYRLVNSGTDLVQPYTIVIEDLVRKSDGSVACTIVQVLNSTWAADKGASYFCIPNSNTPSAIWEQYWQAQQDYSSLEVLRAVNFSLSKRLSMMNFAAYKKSK